MRLLSMVLKLYSAAFSVILGLFLSGLGLFSIFTSASNMKVDALPFWKGETLWYGLLCLGLLGIASGLLALAKKNGVLLLVFTLAAACLMIYGFFISPVYRFHGEAEAKTILWFVLGTLGALIGSLFYFQKPRRA